MGIARHKRSYVVQFDLHLVPLKSGMGELPFPGYGVSVGMMEKFWMMEKVVVMVTHPHECTYCYWIMHWKMVREVYFIRSILPQVLESKKKKSLDYRLFTSLYYVIFNPHFLSSGFRRQSYGWLGDGRGMRLQPLLGNSALLIHLCLVVRLLQIWKCLGLGGTCAPLCLRLE